MQSLHQHQVLFPLLASNLQDLISGFSLQDAYRNYAQNELTLVFGKGEENLSIQINTACKTGLFFFYEYPLTRDAGVFPLFKDLLSCVVTSVQAHAHNRSFQISFGLNQHLVFKMYGPLSNVIYYVGSEPKQLFRAQIENDRNLVLEAFNQEAKEGDLPVFKEHYFVWEQTEPKSIFVLNFGAEAGKSVWQSDNIFEALQYFSKRYMQAFLFEQAHQKLLAQFKQKLKRETALIHGAQQFLNNAATAVPFDEVGHILMANLHQMASKQSEVLLFDFYRNQDILIPLKKDLSPQDNAAYYYQKFKNRKTEIDLKSKQLLLAEKRLLEIKEVYRTIEIAKHLKDLKPWIKEEKQREQTPLKEKFRCFEWQGFQIYVGKNARNNDELTLKFAHKDDLWLHAKGVSGSHVIIKHKQNQNFSEPLIQYAAAVAAYYSSAAGSEWVPVLFTPKKFVRKPKGAHAGQVSVEREETTLVQPRLTP
jgi:predicted ribosome quality control (RQC) complex YloA/Tae2 family protein